MMTGPIAIEGEASNASPSQTELIVSIRALAEAEKTTLVKAAKFYATRTPFDSDDLLQEAICRILSGKRVWGGSIPLLSFFVGVMRSIAWEWKNEYCEDVIEAHDPRCGESTILATIEMANIVAMFADDLAAQKIVMGMMNGVRGKELQRICGLGKVEYESKRRKIRRRIEQLAGSNRNEQKLKTGPIVAPRQRPWPRNP
jgi:DNA-directed RNA polymerase specialized sigma24 family protein